MGLRYVAQYLSHLTELKLSKCWKVTDAGLAQLASLETLTSLDLYGCKLISNQGVQHLSKCRSLQHLVCTNSSITSDALKKFIDESDQKLKLNGLVVASKRPSGRGR